MQTLKMAISFFRESMEYPSRDAGRSGTDHDFLWPVVFPKQLADDKNDRLPTRELQAAAPAQADAPNARTADVWIRRQGNQVSAIQQVVDAY